MCSLSGDAMGIKLWAPTPEVARELMKLTGLGGISVTPTCNALTLFKARVEHISMAFSTEEIVAELASLGVASA